jgi:potassium-transporting ATPase potassium-binding subunit
MTATLTRDLLAIATILTLAVVTAIPIGRYMAWVFSDRPTRQGVLAGPIPRWWLRLAGVAPSFSMTWFEYGRAIVVSNAVMWVVGFLILLAQGLLPANPDHIAGMEPTLAFNTISSFVSNTNLQHYSGETGLSVLSQMSVVVFLQFVTAATGLAALVAVTRGLAADRREGLGNFYVDCARATTHVLLPLAVAVAVLLLWQGLPMTLEPSVQATTLEGRPQVIARGLVAAEVAIKQLGTNGGGYFGANSAHPFENPTPLTNLVETWAILVLPMAAVVMVGRLLGRRRFAVMVFAVMLALYVPLVATSVYLEARPSDTMTSLGVAPDAGSLEGKELRIGAALSGFWAASTTATSNGSVNAMHDSLTPLGGLVPLAGMWINAVFGGVGVGCINLLVYVVIAVFIAGMMVGRTPELFGKKVEGREIKLASLALLLHPLLILGGTAAACVIWVTTANPGATLAWLKNPGPHGFSEMLYEFTSATANNGSGFEGLGDNTAFWNVSTGVVMLLARYVPILAPLALAGSLARKPATPETEGSLSVESATFAVTLLVVILVLGLLMFMPAAVLGPVAEHLALP